MLFTTAAALRAGLTRAQGEGRLEEKLIQLSEPKRPIADELGCLPVEPAASLFLELVPCRFECASLWVTSNRPVGEWGQAR